MKTLLTVVLLFALSPAGAVAQFFPNLSASASPAPAQQGIYQTEAITLDGVPLFRIAAASAPAGGTPEVASRAATVQSALAQLVATSGNDDHTVYDPHTLHVRTVQQGYQAIIEAYDTAHPTALPIVTVTSIDAKYHQTTVPELASQWQTTLFNALYQALLKRQPAIQRKSFDVVVRVFIAVFIVTVLFLLLLRSLRRRIAKLEKRLAERQSKLAAERTTEHVEERPQRERQRRTLALALNLVHPLRGLSALNAAAAIVVWVVVLIWFAFLTWSFYLFPETTPLAHEILSKTLRIGAIWIVAML
ncbi:MAG: hypothetical protein JO165_13440, partial [Candidatus Eremiobacteraeota bacterium]|nr:hypothetical protein [Candidatus Eremiobacteraeota bacterium]